MDLVRFDGVKRDQESLKYVTSITNGFHIFKYDFEMERMIMLQSDIEIQIFPFLLHVGVHILTLITVICTIFCAKNISLVKYFLWPDFTLPRGLAERTSVYKCVLCRIKV